MGSIKKISINQVFRNITIFFKITYESITIPLETDKQNLSNIYIKPISENMDEVSAVFNKVLSTSIKPGQKK